MLYFKQKEYVEDQYSYNTQTDKLKYMIFSFLQGIALFLIVNSFLGGIWTKLGLEMPKDTIIFIGNGTMVYSIQNIHEIIPDFCKVVTSFKSLWGDIAFYCIIAMIGFSIFLKNKSPKGKWKKYIVIVVYIVIILTIAFFHQNEIRIGLAYIIEQFLKLYNSYFGTDLHIMIFGKVDSMWISEGILFLAAILVLLCGIDIFYFQSLKVSLVLIILYTALMFIVGLVPDTTYTCLMVLGIGIIWSLGKRQEPLNICKEKGKVVFQQNYSEKIGIQNVNVFIILAFLIFFLITKLMLTPCFIWFENHRELSNVISDIGNLKQEEFVEKVEEIIIPFNKPNESSMGVSGGELGKADFIKGTEQTDLTITINYPYSGYIYLKGYAGSIYEDNSWKQLSSFGFKVTEDMRLYNENMMELMTVYGTYTDILPEIQVQRVNANAEYEYIPYFSEIDFKEKQYYLNGWLEGDGEAIKNYIGHPLVHLTDILRALDKTDSTYLIENIDDYPSGNILKKCLEYPSILESIKEDFLINAHTSTVSDGGTSEFAELTNRIRGYLRVHAKYSISPGATPKDRDFVEYFLTEQKRGYCTHFASAAVMLYRMCGYPARYVEGYLTKVNGSGEFKVKNNTAHAWVEVYLDGLGWIPVEVTPGYTSENLPDNTVPETEESKEDSIKETEEVITPPTINHEDEADDSNQESNSGGIGVGDSEKPVEENGFFEKAIHFILNLLTNGVMIVLLICVVFFTRSAILLKDRKRRISKGSNRQIVLNLYQFTCRLAAKYNVVMDCEGDIEQMRTSLGMIGIEQGARVDTLTAWKEIVQKAYFYREPVSKDERRVIESVYRELYIVTEMNYMGRFLLKYIYCYPEVK